MAPRLLVIMALLVVSMQSSASCVVLLHGLARTARSMNDMETALTQQGFVVANIDYPSRKKTVEELSTQAVSAGVSDCQKARATPISFVTHSLGGILVRYYLANQEIENLGHVVMLAPPNKGSEVVDTLASVPGFKLFNGPAGVQLGTDPLSIPSQLGPVNFSLGVIAGRKTFNPILSQFLPNPDDGKVSVESTKVEGMSDFLVVDVSHPFIMQDKNVIEKTIEFLHNGKFSAESIGTVVD